MLVHTRDRELVPVAQLKTRRTVFPLLADDGTVLAEFSDDRVEEATILQEPIENAAWREWEIELDDGPAELLDAAAHDLGRLGHRPAELPSKLAHALGHRYLADSPAAPRPSRKGPPASAVLLAYLHEQIEALRTHDPGVREGTPDAVHQLRVAARRMRSVLASFRKQTERNTAKLLREEVQWLAGTVGAARDLEVMQAHLTAAIDAEPRELNTGEAKQHLKDHFRGPVQDGPRRRRRCPRKRPIL